MGFLVILGIESKRDNLADSLQALFPSDDLLSQGFVEDQIRGAQRLSGERARGVARIDPLQNGDAFEDVPCLGVLDGLFHHLQSERADKMLWNCGVAVIHGVGVSVGLLDGLKMRGLGCCKYSFVVLLVRGLQIAPHCLVPRFQNAKILRGSAFKTFCVSKVITLLNEIRPFRNWSTCLLSKDSRIHEREREASLGIFEELCPGTRDERAFD